MGQAPLFRKRFQGVFKGFFGVFGGFFLFLFRWLEGKEGMVGKPHYDCASWSGVGNG